MRCFLLGFALVSGAGPDDCCADSDTGVWSKVDAGTQCSDGTSPTKEDPAANCASLPVVLSLWKSGAGTVPDSVSFYEWNTASCSIAAADVVGMTKDTSE